MPTFDGENLIITLDPVVDGVLTVDVQNDLYEPWKDWLRSSPKNRGYPQAFRTTGGDELTSIINAGAYFFLRNDYGWRIKPAENDGDYFMVGNLAAQTTDRRVFASTTGSFTTAVLGLQPVTQGVTPVMAQQLRHAAFNGGVWIDVVNGQPYTSIANNEGGTEKYPLDNFADGITVADNEGFGTFFILGDVTINSGLDYTNRVFVGQGQNLSLFTLDPNAVLVNCSFIEAEVTGTLDGDTHLEDCIVSGLDFVSGVIERCILNSNIITLGGSTIAHFIDCRSGVPGTGTPIVDMGGAGQGLAMRNYNGGITLTNKSGTESVSIDLNSGQVRLTNSVTNGTIVVRGVGKLVDDATGQRIPSGNWNGATIINETIDSKDLLLARKLLSNKVIVAGDDSQTVIYDDDGITTLWTFNHSSTRDRIPA